VCVIELTFGGVFIIEEILDPLHGLVANVKDEIFKLLGVGGGELPGVGVNGRDEGGGRLVEVGVQLLQVLVHLGDGVDHVL